MYVLMNIFKYMYIASLISVCSYLCNVPFLLALITYSFYFVLECFNDHYLYKKIRKQLLSRIITKHIDRIVREERAHVQNRTGVDDSS